MATRAQIIEIYTGYYDRAADATGLAYWETNGADMTDSQVAESFAEQDETKAKYPDTLSTANFVNEIYKNVLNRDADPDGLAYWSKALDDKTVSRADMILAVMNGAQGDDQKTLDNKSKVSDDFASSGLNDYDNSVTALKDVTSDEATVTAAKAQIDIWSDENSTTDFTTERDNLVGTDAADIFSGVVSGSATLQGFDSVDGGDGKDTLHITSNSGAVTAAVSGQPQVSNIETLKITDNGTSYVMDTKNIDANIDNLIIDGKSKATTLGGVTGSQDLKAIFDDITLSGTATTGATVNVNYAVGATVGTTDEQNITLTNGVKQTLTTTGIETALIHTGTGSESIVLSDTATKSVIIDGAANLNLGTSTVFTSVDGSSMTGSLSYVSGAAALTSLSGGSANDILDDSAGSAAATISGGAGKDTITSSAAGGDTIIGGAGKDTIKLTKTTATLVYSDKSDSVSGAADVITGTTSGKTKINVTEAIVASGGTATYAAMADASNFTSPAASLGEGEAFIGTGKAGTTHVYIDTAAKNIYIDINQDNIFKAADDLVINDASGNLVMGDIII